jgi:kanamycin kinase
MEGMEGSTDFPVPEDLRERFRVWNWAVVWHYLPDTVTYRLTAEGQEAIFLKLAPSTWYPSLEGEGERMTWAVRHLPVPRVMEQGSEGGVSWLLTRGLPGHDATHLSFKAQPQKLVRTLARGLRSFHGAPVGVCPFDFRLDAALGHVRRRVAKGRVWPERDFHEEFNHLDAPGALALLEDTRPASEDLVVCHGDYCLPNVLIQEGAATGFLDLGELGVADRWWDLAVATWSVTWNLGPGFEELFLAEYGIPRDEERVAFYRLLYDLVS